MGALLQAPFGMQGHILLLLSLVPLCSCALRVTHPTDVHCPSFTSCSECGKHANCGWCSDVLRGKEAGCVAPDAICRMFESRECLCEKAYSAMFPGTSMMDAGPCQKVLKGNFKPNTCDPKDSYKGLSCPNAAAQMITACKKHIIPDIPKGNPTAGSLFNEPRANLIQAAYKKAGCSVDDQILVDEGLPEPEPVSKRLKYVIKQNFRGDCPESNYAGSMCGVPTSQAAQDECTRDVHCKSYVWAGPKGNQKGKNEESFPNCLWMCTSVPEMFASWSDGQPKDLMGWEAGYVSSLSTPSPTPPSLQKLATHVDLTGTGKMFTPTGFKALGKDDFLKAVAQAMGGGIMSSEITINKVIQKSSGTIRVSFTLATYNRDLEDKIKKGIVGGNFAAKLSVDLQNHGIKDSRVAVNKNVQRSTAAQKSAGGGSNLGIIGGLLLGVAAGVAAVYMRGEDLSLAMGKGTAVVDEEAGSGSASEKQGLTADEGA